ncbi:glycogen synthase [Lacunimicrobium album]
MNIILASSEAVPFAKTGGLADVATSLSEALANLGHDVTLVLPHYPQVMPQGHNGRFKIQPYGHPFAVKIGKRLQTGRFLSAKMVETSLSVVLIDQPDYYDRPQLYLQDGTDYEDNCERFVFFSRAVVELARQFTTPPDIIHANDWQTGLVPVLVSEELRKDPRFAGVASVQTIHNINYQGRFWHWDMPLTGLDWKYFNWKQMEFYGELNLLKSGITFADMITTVSPTYAREIQTPEYGCGLETVLRNRRESLAGILNGVSHADWNPATDWLIESNYSLKSIDEGKPICKADLQETMKLPVRDDVPILGMISRMTDQKGFDLIIETSELLMKMDIQLVFLGTGDRRYETFLDDLAERYPDKVATYIGFSEEVAHKIEAGSDIFLMPSRFEPCGLNQMYSMIYGTVPIVHRVGGLADSVVNVTTSTLSAGTANGFSFDHYTGSAFIFTVQEALRVFEDKQTWQKIVQNGMSTDWTWKRSANQYVDVYQRALEKIRPTPASSEVSENPPSTTPPTTPVDVR